MGLNVLWPDSGQATPAAVWLAEASRKTDLPPAYFADNALTRHLQAALWFVAQQMTQKNHLSLATMKAFDSLSYVAEDPSASAYCIDVDGTYVIVIGKRWLFRLVKISDRLGPALDARPRAGVTRASVSPSRDDQLTDLLWDREDIDDAEAIRIAEAWPSAGREFVANDLGPWAIFYDLIRLTWMHEWAHALCGHVAVAKTELNQLRLNESSVGRARFGAFGSWDYPASEVMQCFEMHADEFSVRYSLGELLYGHDPVGRVVAEKVDLNDRLLHLNAAFCIFAVIWALDEMRNFPGTRLPTENTHPPVGLRYDRFRGFQREATLGYNTQLMTAVDASSTAFLNTLMDTSGCFGGLMAWTPMSFRTPSMESFEKYEQYLMRIDPVLWPALENANFIPTTR